MTHTSKFVKVKCPDCGNEQISLQEAGHQRRLPRMRLHPDQAPRRHGEMKGELLEVVD